MGNWGTQILRGIDPSWATIYPNIGMDEMILVVRNTPRERREERDRMGA